MRVEFHPETSGDLNSAIAFYNELRTGLGDALRTEVYSAIDRVLFNPRQYAVVEEDIRRCLVHRFPYSILFREIGPTPSPAASGLRTRAAMRRSFP